MKKTSLIGLMVLAAFVGIQAMDAPKPEPMELEIFQESEEYPEAEERAHIVSEAIRRVTPDEFEQKYGRTTPKNVGRQYKHFYESKFAQLDPALVDYFRAAALYKLTGDVNAKAARKAISKAHDLDKYDAFIYMLMPKYMRAVRHMSQEVTPQRWELSYAVPVQIN